MPCDRRAIARLTAPRRAASGGFTLLEILVVLVIIGILAVATVLSLGASGRDGQLQQEGQRLSALVAYVQDRGAILTRDYGILCGKHGYRFTYFDQRRKRWLAATADNALRPRRLPKGLSLRLVIEGRQVVLNDRALQIPNTASGGGAAGASGAPASGGAGGPGLAGSFAGGSDSSVGASNGPLSDGLVSNTPQIMLLSSGDTNSFALTIVRDRSGRSITLRSKANGTVQLGHLQQSRPLQPSS